MAKQNQAKEEKLVKEKNKKTIKELFSDDIGGNSRRCAVVCAIIVAVVIGINMMLTALPTKIANIDISTEGIHSISEETETFIKELEQEVNVYLVGESGEEDSNTMIMLNLYADLSDKLTVTTVDPSYDPAFVMNYVGDTTVSDNTIIVVSGDRRKVMAYSEYRSGSTYALEDYLNNAINFVISDEMDKVYTLSGHGETELSDDLISDLAVDGFEVETLDLMAEGEIPEDAKGIIINGMTADISEEEGDILLEYLQNGGRLLLITGYEDEAAELPNLENVTSYYGATIEAGYVVEGDSSYYVEEEPTNILPYILTDTNEDITDGVAYVMMPEARSILLDEDVREDVDVAIILQSTESAYVICQDGSTATTQNEEDCFYLGVTFAEELEEGETRIAWFTSMGISDETVDAYVGGGNSTMLCNAINWVCEDDSVDIENGKSLSTTYISVDSGPLNIWKNVMIIILPLLVLAIGAIVCIRRKRR